MKHPHSATPSSEQAATLNRIVPCDLKAGYLADREAIDSAIARVLESGWYLIGRELETFERAFADWLGVGHGVGVANGTDAIELALRAAGLGVGDLVFTVSHTAVATVAAIERCGATPVLVDIDPHRFTMDPQQFARAAAATRDRAGKRAVVPVHLYGHPADMHAILKIARAENITVIEDAAQAHGATIDGRKVGTFGDYAAFSFYPTKNLGALGDAGMVVTDDAESAERCLALRQYGWRQRSVSREPGVNSRLDEMQAAVLNVKLRTLDRDNARRRAIAQRYSAALAGRSDVIQPAVAADCEHVFHLYFVLADQREALRQHLDARAIATAIHYPQPVHRQPAYAERLPRVVALDQTEAVSTRILTLPLHPHMSDEQVDRVVDALESFNATAPPLAA